jgi:hypothetical protein
MLFIAVVLMALENLAIQYGAGVDIFMLKS